VGGVDLKSLAEAERGLRKVLLVKEFLALGHLGFRASRAAQGQEYQGQDSSGGAASEHIVVPQ
jgi:hypothetical protein